MSDTPRTDKMEYSFEPYDSSDGVTLRRECDGKDVAWDKEFDGPAVPAEFARQLERDLNEMIAWKEATITGLEKCKAMLERQNRILRGGSPSSEKL